MKPKLCFTLAIVSTLAALAFSGCTDEQAARALLTKPEAKPDTQIPDTARRFRQNAPQQPTAVESAIELSRKYARLSEETAALRAENQRLLAEKNNFDAVLDETKAELAQAQKELAEANTLLVDMRVELNNWKTDVLGFRGEIRDAEKAQLEALLKILTILGGRVTLQETKALDKHVAKR
jgi:chromosome segregation ATPase